MAYKASYTGTGSQTDYAVSFPYLKRSHIGVTVDGVVATFTWVNDGIIRMDAAPASGTAVELKRTTQRTPIIVLQDTKPIPASSYMKLATQSLYVAEESEEGEGVFSPLLPDNNLSELTDPNAALANLGGGVTGIEVFKGATPAIIKSRLGFQVDLTHFGTVTDGQSIDTAYQAALDFATQRGYGEIVIPAGEYYFEQGHIYSFSNLSPNPTRNEYGIRGAAQGLTRLVFDAASAPTDGLGFRMTSLGANARFNFTDFSILSDGACAGIYGLTAARMVYGGISPEPSVKIHNVAVRGRNWANDYFGAGAVDIRGSLYPEIVNVNLSGAQGGGTDYTDTSKFYKSLVGINIDGTYGGFMDGSFVKYFSTGMSNEWATSPAGEGMNLHDTNFVLNKIGLKYTRSVTEPALKVIDCHFNNRDVNLWIKGCFGADVMNNSFYNQATGYTAHSASPIPGKAFDVYCENTYEMLFAHNRHRGIGGAGKALYKFVSGANDPTNIRIHSPVLEGCTFTNLVDGPAELTGFVSDPVISSNSVNTGGRLLSVTTPIGIRYTNPRILAMAVASAQVIPNNVNTNVIWSEGSDTEGLHSNVTDPDRVTIPAGKGIKWVKFNGNGAFANNNLGTRQFSLFKNGAGVMVNYGASITQDGTAAGPERISWATGWLPVVEGDYFTVVAYQNTGADLALETLYTNCVVEVAG